MVSPQIGALEQDRGAQSLLWKLVLLSMRRANSYTANRIDEELEDTEQKIVNEGSLPCVQRLDDNELTHKSRIQDMEEEQPFPLRHDPEVCEDTGPCSVEDELKDIAPLLSGRH